MNNQEKLIRKRTRDSGEKIVPIPKTYFLDFSNRHFRIQQKFSLLSFDCNVIICISFSEYDVDGKTLKMMNSVERISQLIPKFKQQLLFLEEREKLFKKINDYSVQCDGSLSNISTNSQTTSMVPISSQTTSMVPINSQTTSMVPINSQPSSFVPVPATDSLSKESMDYSRSDHSDVGADINIAFPDDYKIPLLPKALIKDIEDGILEKFGPHCANRQILIDAIVYDLLDKYNLL